MIIFLLKKHTVIGVDNLVSVKEKNLKDSFKNKRFKFVKDDIQNIDKICKRNKIRKIDYIFHFAGHGELIPSIENPLDYLRNNAFKTAILC